MTEPSNTPSEAEVEAARRAVFDINLDHGLDLSLDGCDEIARAALTAAAQVRDRAVFVPKPGWLNEVRDVVQITQEREKFLRIKSEIPPEVIDCFLSPKCPDGISCSRCHAVVSAWLDGGKERHERGENVFKAPEYMAPPPMHLGEKGDMVE